MRLVDADKLITDLKKYVENIKNIRDDGKCFLTEENVLNIIKEQPTAFDVDKVVEQLEEENALYCAKFIICKKKGNDTLAKENLDRANLLDKAIKIVKAGGIDD